MQMMRGHQTFSYVIGVASTSPTMSIVQPASTSTTHAGGFISQPTGSLAHWILVHFVVQS